MEVGGLKKGERDQLSPLALLCIVELDCKRNCAEIDPTSKGVANSDAALRLKESRGFPLRTDSDASIRASTVQRYMLCAVKGIKSTG